MVRLGAILWMLVLAWLIGSLPPSREMQRHPAGYFLYYPLWAGVCGVLFFAQHRLVAHSHYATLAILSNALGIGLGCIRLWSAWWLRRQQQAKRNKPPTKP